jgi:thioester reductase-like protein
MEVESVLVRHPDVAMAAVVVRTVAGEDRLIAYVVVATGCSFDTQKLKSFVKDALPAHLCPAAFVNIEAMPKMLSGKVNLDALPQPIEQPDRNPASPKTELQVRLARIWSEILGIRQVSLADNFFECGGNSLSAIKIYLRINDEFGTDLPLRSVIEAIDFASLAGEVEEAVVRKDAAGNGYSQVRRVPAGVSRRDRAANASTEYRSDAKLDPSLQPLAGAIVPLSKAQVVAVTGVTGFIGAFTVKSLLERTSVQVYCPVRACSVREGRIRIERMLAASGVTARELLERVLPFRSDLSRPRLGLSPADYEQIAAEADAVFHCGRMSNFVLPYANHRAVNVVATIDVLRLAATIKPKGVHFASTLSVLSPLRTGYERSRWVAEQLMADAHVRGFCVAVYRAGRLAGDTRTTAFPPGQFISALVKGCVEIGRVPEFNGLKVDVTPVDYASECIVSLATLPDSFGKVFAICHPEFTKWGTILDGLRRFGYSMETSEFATWLHELRAALDGNVLAPFWSVLEEWQRSSGTVASGRMPAEAVLEAVDARSVHQLVERLGIVCPSIDDQLIGHYLTALVRTGYLPAPDREGGD